MITIKQCILISIFTFGSLAASAATTLDNKDDGSAIGTSDTPQIKEQMKSSDKTTTKTATQKSRTGRDNKKMKMMDINSDGTVSKEEYMSAQEKAFEKMNPTDEGVKY